jgi:hypothetical protein
MKMTHNLTKLFKIVFIFFICSYTFNAIGQTIIYDGKGNIIAGTHIKFRPGNEVKILDSLTNNYYVLDSSHIYITAYNKDGKELWKTDPYKDSKIEEYRVIRPVIVNFEFITSHWCYRNKLKKTIWINYNNTQAGYIDLNSGKFHFCGQD